MRVEIPNQITVTIGGLISRGVKAVDDSRLMINPDWKTNPHSGTGYLSIDIVRNTVREALDERLGPLLPALEALLAQQGRSIDDLGAALTLPR